MKLKSILDTIVAILPFLKRKDAKEIREFSELITGQYEFLASQLERVMKDYFEVSAKVHEMHTEIFNLKAQLADAATLQCFKKECVERVSFFAGDDEKD